MNLDEILHSDVDILGGQIVFTGTRVPVESLFDHLEEGISINEFLDDFPTVSKQQVMSLLEMANKVFTTKNVKKLYEIIT